MQEIWKDVKGYEGFYQISNLGRVKSFRCNKEKLLKPVSNGIGYLRVDFSLNKKHTKFLVHRLVAMAFIENKNNFQQVNHKDENKSNNSVNNLEWCTLEYNINYGTRKERIRNSNTYGKNAKKVGQYINDIKISEFKSTMDVQRKLGFKQPNISACCIGKCNQAYGYQWKYI